MEVFAARFQAHPPMIVRHLFEMNRSSRRHNLIEGRSSIGQFTLGSDFDGTAVLFPFHTVILKWNCRYNIPASSLVLVWSKLEICVYQDCSPVSSSPS